VGFREAGRALVGSAGGCCTVVGSADGGVYFHYLRTKIDKGFNPPLILTRWSEGYMLRRSPEPPGDQRQFSRARRCGESLPPT
jgi:hypothetical protein